MSNDAELDEENKRRLSLGLKPLSRKKKGIEKRKEKVVQDAQTSIVHGKELQKSVSTSTEHQDHCDFTSGPSLGDSLTRTPSESAKDWAKSLTRRSQALKLSEAPKEEENVTEHDLSGIKVRHSDAEFSTERSVVLTLKDTSLILGERLNEDAAELENIELVEEERRKKQKSTKEMPGYMRSFETEKEEEKSIVLGIGGVYSRKKEAEEAFSRKRVRKDNEIAYDLSVNKSVDSDFVTAEYEPQFKKRRRKPQKANSDSLGLLLPVLEDSDDFGSREGKVSSVDQKTSEDRKERKRRYAKAFEIASEISIKDEEDEDLSDFQLTQKLPKKLSGQAYLLQRLENSKKLSQVQEKLKTEEFEEDLLFSSTANLIEDLPTFKVPPLEDISISAPKTVPNEPQLESFVQDPILGRGIGVALDLLRKRGALNPEKSSISSRVAGQSNGIDEHGSSIRIEHIDEFGRKMTAKEAFKQMSQVYHNKRPGMKRREKRLKEREREIRAKKIAGATAGSEKVSSLMKLQKASKNAGKAYVELDSLIDIKPE